MLLSFTGMAEVLDWPQRAPLVAPCDRERVLATWTAACAGRRPRLLLVPFADIRHLQPAEFVALLAVDLKAGGVVAGRNYRFGYRAAGDAAALQVGTAAAAAAVAAALLLLPVGHSPPPPASPRPCLRRGAVARRPAGFGCAGGSVGGGGGPAGGAA